jgi:predicted metallopeptidase
MKSFFNILQTIIKSDVVRYPGETNKFIPLTLNTTSDMYTNYSVYSFICKIQKEFNTIKSTSFITKSASSKFKALNHFLNNKFNSERQVECVFDAFSKAQRLYFAFNKFVNIYKLKKYPKVVTDDLSMTPLNINSKNTMTIVQNKSIYLFNLNELIHIIETAIGHSPSFFSDPQRPKNPFNNEEFSNAILYNIYFKMKDSVRITSTIFHLYFLSNFDNDEFVINNEAFLREFSIKKYVFTTPALCLWPSVIEMLSANVFTKKLTIHKKFPKEQLVEIFRPFLYLYYIVNYDIRGTHKLSKYKRILHYKLKQFYEYNKAFGRQIIEIIPKPVVFPNTIPNPNTILSHLLDKPGESSNSVSKKKSGRKTKVTFNSKHISFYNIDISDVQADIEEAAQLLFYFSANVEYDSSEAESEAESEDDESVQNVVTNTSTNDPEVSTLEDSEAEDSDDESSTQFNEEQNDNEYDTDNEYNNYNDDDDDDSIS